MRVTCACFNVMSILIVEEVLRRKTCNQGSSCEYYVVLDLYQLVNDQIQAGT